MKPLASTRAFDLPCRFGERHGRFRVYVGNPARGFASCHFQLAWLREARGGEVALRSLERLLDHAETDV